MANVLVSAPKQARAGEIVEIRTLASHPMETGFRAGTNGTLIPRDIVREFSCSYGGVTVFRMELSPAIAANPYIAFHLRARETGPIVLRWTGDNGFSVEETVTLQVA
ncbi:MAG: thiosulfate oxidation carrier complex protein SoxZ [Alphaproteobacteria bacterium]|nr:thiosulfate oxidation carrier complex protein SoxZ [Alphaproteobacteria bacterium]